MEDCILRFVDALKTLDKHNVIFAFIVHQP